VNIAMSAWQFILSSLRHHRRIHVAVGLGVAVATAVLAGALLVGDSVRGSLRGLTLERLGRIHEVLVPGPLFRAALADELAAAPAVKQHYAEVEPLLLLAGSLQAGSGAELRRATQVTIIGLRDNFWTLGEGATITALAAGEVALTEVVAHELNVRVGDQILIRVPAIDALPTESLLGETDENTRSRRFRVARVLPPEGLARFGLQPSQHSPRNVFLPLASMQSVLEQPAKANVLLVAGRRADSPPDESVSRALQAALKPQLEDYGLRVEQIESSAPYWRVSSDQLVLRDEIVAAVRRAFEGETLQPVVTYLANTIAVGEGESRRQIPYSTISGVGSIAGLGPVLDEAGLPIALADDEIALNRWAADDLQAKIGDDVTITFYEPESTHGKLSEHRPPTTFKLKAIVNLKTADGRPTAAADPKFTPDMSGVTDQNSINDWDVPFELVEPRRPQDDDYWDEYRTTPKAFVSLATAKRLWGSRWGSISLMRIPSPAAGETASAAGDPAARLERAIDPAALGMSFQPVKRLGLDAASGTTPFDGLFLGFSVFLIASAVMLIAILFQLGVAGRADEIGTLAAVGVDRRRTSRLLTREGLIVAILGASAGMIAGVLYALLMITGLRTWWVAAVATPFLELHVTPRSLAIGWLAGVLVSWLTIRYSVRRLVRLPTWRLLAGQTETMTETSGGRNIGQAWPTARLALAAATVGLVALGFTLRDEAQAGVFFGSGAAVLVLLLGEVRHQLRARRSTNAGRGLSILGLAARNTARHPGRSTLTIGLVASASFLIVAMSAFRLETSDAGTGGFTLLATSDQPIVKDLNSADDRLDLGFSDADSDALSRWRVFSLRVRSGEDASCLNLYQPSQPTVLGLPEALIDRGGFAWAAALLQQGPSNNPWLLLNAKLENDDHGRPVIPVVLDANTATYSLKIGLGDRLTIPDDVGRDRTLEVVGLLKNSVLQGKLLVSQANFIQLYPDVAGYRFFLIERSAGVGGEADVSADAVAKMLESTLAREQDPGFDATPAAEQLAEFLAVQNTYLSTFQSLGALGLLLGTIGLAVVQLRSVIERRGELALMRASGFRRRRLVMMVLGENGVLLLGGLAIGCLAAAVALVPQWDPQAAQVPWQTLANLLAVIALVGLAAGWLATRTALRAPIVPALRGD
jgi:ABC-type antimicrobial peptide transport system permease subunit